MKFGLDSGLGGGSLFGNTSSLGGTGLGGMGQMNMNLTGGTLSGVSTAGNVHEHMLALAARPYGDTGLFKDLFARCM
ncbi:jg20559 [Pararge aegeria aegeria]|uniref:Jg20559 protein n=1 Tax=Pararge aegeria aegeria TaxID=348720 RepID=A0A8S4QZH8_9NEOP|nr:jg20559 [Pararge aegeria aegeria]